MCTRFATDTDVWVILYLFRWYFQGSLPEFQYAEDDCTYVFIWMNKLACQITHEDETGRDCKVSNPVTGKITQNSNSELKKSRRLKFGKVPRRGGGGVLGEEVLENKLVCRGNWIILTCNGSYSSQHTCTFTLCVTCPTMFFFSTVFSRIWIWFESSPGRRHSQHIRSRPTRLQHQYMHRSDRYPLWGKQHRWVLYKAMGVIFWAGNVEQVHLF